MAREYPKTMYHANHDPKLCHTPDEIKALGPGWYTTYIYREFPKFMYGMDGEPIKVMDKFEEEKRIAEGYSKTPVAVKKVATDQGPYAGRHSDTESSLKIQILEFEVENLKEQVGGLIEAVADLRTEHGKLVAELNEPVTVETAAASRSKK